MTNLIETKNLKKYFTDGSGNELHILNGINTAFPKNRTISISGASGSGKSTLLHLLGGLDHPTEGEVFFLNNNIFKLNNKDLANWRNQKIGFVFQANYLLPDFSALENVIIPALIANRPKNEASDQAEHLLKLVNLSDRLSHKPRQLSGGEQQRVAIARALINQPQLILADEPTGNLDTRTGEIVGKLLQQISSEQGATLIIVTHNNDLAADMDHQLKLDNGLLISSP